MRLSSTACLAIAALTSNVASAALGASPAQAPDLTARFKPTQVQAVLKEREIATLARLSEPDARKIQIYSVGGIMRVRAPLARVRAVMTDYPVYKKMIRYVDRADFDKSSGNLALEGGIFKYRLISTVHFEERSPEWVHYTFVGGHFQGLTGDMTFKDLGERGTLVAFSGEIAGERLPPRFVIEKGAEIVFGYTAGRMRSFIENDTAAPTPAVDALPAPRKRLTPS